MEDEKLLQPNTIRVELKNQTGNVLKRSKKHAMPFIDVVLVIFIVNPLTIGNWRGTWALMDYYSTSFPPWESFILGGALHLCFTIMRKGLQDLVRLEANSVPKICLLYGCRRLYTYLFSVACIMNWRGSWIIFDDWVGVKTAPDGKVLQSETSSNVALIVLISVLMVVILMILRVFRNALASPFVTSLDTKESAFDFPTRYKKTIFYTTLMYNTINTNANTNVSIPLPEKLIGSPVTIEKQAMENVSPRPFINDLRGPSPSGFSPSATTSPIFNQNPTTYPNNIQDIIHYLAGSKNHREKEAAKDEHLLNIANKDKFKVYGKIRDNRYRKHHGYDEGLNFNRDPFFAFKPQNPSDINLMAPNNFRFAPAMVSTAHGSKNRQVLNNLTVNGFHGYQKPLSLMLNIYPSDDEFNRHGQKLQRVKNQMIRPGRMVVHLNLYPGFRSSTVSPAGYHNMFSN